MDFKSKASITLTSTLSAAEILDAVQSVPGADAAILDAAQAAAEAAKAPAGLTVVTRSLTQASDGSAIVDLVYEKVDVVTKADADPLALQDQQQAAQDGVQQPAPPLSLQPLGLTSATA